MARTWASLSIVWNEVQHQCVFRRAVCSNPIQQKAEKIAYLLVLVVLAVSLASATTEPRLVLALWSEKNGLAGLESVTVHNRRAHHLSYSALFTQKASKDSSQDTRERVSAGVFLVEKILMVDADC